MADLCYLTCSFSQGALRIAALFADVVDRASTWQARKGYMFHLLICISSNT